MTNEEFWKKLDRLAGKKRSVNHLQLFVETLTQGYYQNLHILVSGVLTPGDQTSFHQVCSYNEKGDKSLLFYTDRRYAEVVAGKLPAIVMSKPQCIEAECRAVINNALQQENVNALIFNCNTPQAVTIPKLLLELALLSRLSGQ